MSIGTRSPKKLTKFEESELEKEKARYVWMQQKEKARIEKFLENKI